MIVLVRIDDKLLHAQIMWGWAQALKASTVVIANDKAAGDELRKGCLMMAVKGSESPENHPVVKILHLEEAVNMIKNLDDKTERTILVVSKPADLLFLMGKGISIKNVSVGWMSSRPDRENILQTISVDKNDIQAFRRLSQKGVNLTYQRSPSDTGENMMDYIN
ncbi:hypothetical protein GF312_22405 [Candidatus Poribacteria bacterium]|nr:hypothetical protein [Candidatus Poribacteria bacterium]